MSIPVCKRLTDMSELCSTLVKWLVMWVDSAGVQELITIHTSPTYCINRVWTNKSTLRQVKDRFKWGGREAERVWEWWQFVQHGIVLSLWSSVNHQPVASAISPWLGPTANMITHNPTEEMRVERERERGVVKHSCVFIIPHMNYICKHNPMTCWSSTHWWTYYLGRWHGQHGTFSCLVISDRAAT